MTTGVHTADLSLAAVLAPLTVQEFAARCLPLRFLHQSGGAGHFEGLRELLPELDGLLALAGKGHRPCRAVGPVNGRPEGVYVRSAEQARALYAAGFTIMLDHIAGFFPPFACLARDAEIALGVPAGTCSVKISVSGRDGGFPPHYDRYDSFQVQIAGSKAWYVAGNDYVKAPLHPHIIGQPVNPILAAYCKRPLPDVAPPSRRVELVPGALLFVPRGYWHATAAGAWSVTVILRCAAPARLQLLPPDLSAARLPDPRWREPVYGAWGGHPGHTTAIAQLDALLEESLPGTGLDAGRLVRDFDVEAYLNGSV